jgi:hypothetical protein
MSHLLCKIDENVRPVIEEATVPNKNGSVIYEGYSKINLRLVGKNKRVGIALNHKLSRNKQRLFSLNTNPHAFSLHSVGVIADETRTLPSLLPPAMRYVL